MADLHPGVLARLDRLLADHRPMAEDPESGCCPGGCVADAARAVQAVLEVHRPQGTLADGMAECRECVALRPHSRTAVRWPCPTVLAVAEAMGIGEVG